MTTSPQPTDIRLQITFATVQLQPTQLTEADFKAESSDFHRLLHANERAEGGFLFVHKATCIVEKKDSEAVQGLMQSAMFDTEKSNGKAELRELLDAVRQTVMQRFYDWDVSDPILG